MTFSAKGPAPGGRAGPLLELSSYGGVDGSDLKPPRPKTQIKFQDPAEAEFDAEIARSLTASGWRASAYLLMHAARFIEAGDYLSADRNRQRAREQFIEANDLFRQFQEMRAAEAVSLFGARRHLLSAAQTTIGSMRYAGTPSKGLTILGTVDAIRERCGIFPRRKKWMAVTRLKSPSSA